ncbi:MAG: hypothetical protein EHM20_16015 [Alphaproteobacteria bacterium]|nr:MAG: hypothetical protein EHM20_16015 [Alphaproteobacteria bacterium]
MSTRISFRVECECSHVGKINLHEGDGPKFWENYSLESLEGKSFESETPVDFKRVFAEMRPTCPNCKRRLTRSNLKTN